MSIQTKIHFTVSGDPQTPKSTKNHKRLKTASSFYGVADIFRQQIIKTKCQEALLSKDFIIEFYFC